MGLFQSVLYPFGRLIRSILIIWGRIEWETFEFSVVIRFKVKEFSIVEIVPYPIKVSWEGQAGGDSMATGMCVYLIAHNRAIWSRGDFVKNWNRVSSQSSLVIIKKPSRWCWKPLDSLVGENVTKLPPGRMLGGANTSLAAGRAKYRIFFYFVNQIQNVGTKSWKLSTTPIPHLALRGPSRRNYH